MVSILRHCLSFVWWKTRSSFSPPTKQTFRRSHHQDFVLNQSPAISFCLPPFLFLSEIVIHSLTKALPAPKAIWRPMLLSAGLQRKKPRGNYLLLPTIKDHMVLRQQDSDWRLKLAAFSQKFLIKHSKLSTSLPSNTYFSRKVLC